MAVDQTQTVIEEPYDYEVPHTYSGNFQYISWFSAMNWALSFGKLFLLVVNAIVFFFIVYITKRRQTPHIVDKIVKNNDKGKKRNVVIVIAHPDDEAMFMTPTILSLTEQKDVKVHLLCLSNGNCAGLGKQRVKELGKSCHVLSIINDPNQVEEITRVEDVENTDSLVVVIDHEKLQDGMQNKWDHELIAQFLDSFAKKHDIESV